MEKMLVTQALDERDLLEKKINDKINKAKFVDIIKVNEERTVNSKLTREEFEAEAKSEYQQIKDLIDRFSRLEAAIVLSNATTKIQTSRGEMTVAAAITLRNRLKGKGYSTSANFEGHLEAALELAYKQNVMAANGKNSEVQNTAETMRLSILGKDTKVKDDKPLAVVDAYVKENTTELADPLDAKKTFETMKEQMSALTTELDTQIKVSNATTFIEF